MTSEESRESQDKSRLIHTTVGDLHKEYGFEGDLLREGGGIMGETEEVTFNPATRAWAPGHVEEVKELNDGYSRYLAR